MVKSACGGLRRDLISPSVKRSISPEGKARRFHRANGAIPLYTLSGARPIFLFLWQNAVYLLGAFRQK
ncbi:MAG TPA: hypothetical protein DEW35_03575 [Ruminococcaceae bacterium]|nr:hypothetical protein [Oscillospiraceae bacterium]